jgi:glycosyltransferase involved in cell wall biosynthesis
MSPLPADGIICLSTDPWGEMKRPGQLMLCLAKRVPIVYAEPVLSVTSLVKNWKTSLTPAVRKRVRRALLGHADEVAPGVHVVTTLVSIPPQRLPAGRFARIRRALNVGQQRRIQRRAHRAAKHLGLRAPAVWVSYPIWLTEPSGGETPVVVYDCMDRWEAFPDAIGDPAWRGEVMAAERRLLERADVVFCSSAGLVDTRSEFAAGPVTLVRNGADMDHFAPTGRPVPKDVGELPRPLIGYVGALAEWVDFDLLRSAAALRPGWSFALIGPSFKGKTSGDVGALRLVSDLPNLHLLGPRHYADVPAYVEAFDVAIIPFKLNGLTEDTNPIKVYEYLAAGVPVVSTPLPEVIDLPQVRCAVDADGFVRQCEEAWSERWDSDAISLRREVAAANSWEERAGVIWQTILDHQS